MKDASCGPGPPVPGSAEKLGHGPARSLCRARLVSPTLRRMAAPDANFGPLSRARLFRREQALPAVGHPGPDSPALKVPGGARHAPAFVDVLLEFLGDVHWPCPQRVLRVHINP